MTATAPEARKEVARLRCRLGGDQRKPFIDGAVLVEALKACGTNLAGAQVYDDLDAAAVSVAAVTDRSCDWR